MSDRPEPEFHSHFTFGSETSFAVVRTDGEARESFLHVVKQVDIDIEKGPQGALEQATQVIDEAIAEEKIPAAERERLVQEARSGYFRVFLS